MDLSDMEVYVENMDLENMDDSEIMTSRPMQVIRDERARQFKILLADNLTPLLRKELKDAIKLHEKHPKAYEEFDALSKRIDGHWRQVNGRVARRVYMIQNMNMLQKFLTAKLLEEYTKETFTLDSWVCELSDVISRYHAPEEASQDQHGDAKCQAEGDSEWDEVSKGEEEGSKTQDKDDTDHEAESGQEDAASDQDEDRDEKEEAYASQFVFPVQELMLDLRHVEKRVLSAVAQKQGGGGFIQQLVNQGDWTNLATALADDRHLVDTLYGKTPIVPNHIDKHKGRKILQGIEKIESKYLPKPHRSIREQAKEILGRHGSGDNEKASGSSPLPTSSLPGKSSEKTD